MKINSPKKITAALVCLPFHFCLHLPTHTLTPTPPIASTFQNPILPGFHPDPSHLPASVPITTSSPPPSNISPASPSSTPADLVHWQTTRLHPLPPFPTRPRQPVQSQRRQHLRPPPSATTTRTFYMITTLRRTLPPAITTSSSPPPAPPALGPIPISSTTPPASIPPSSSTMTAPPGTPATNTPTPANPTPSTAKSGSSKIGLSSLHAHRPQNRLSKIRATSKALTPAEKPRTLLQSGWLLLSDDR